MYIKWQGQFRAIYYNGELQIDKQKYEMINWLKFQMVSSVIANTFCYNLI